MFRLKYVKTFEYFLYLTPVFNQIERNKNSITETLMPVCLSHLRLLSTDTTPLLVRSDTTPQLTECLSQNLSKVRY